MNTPTCVACGAVLATPLETYGDLDAPMCLGCWTEPSNDLFDRPFFRYEDMGDGWQLKRLTAAGAAYLGGKEGDALMKVNHEEHILEVLLP